MTDHTEPPTSTMDRSGQPGSLESVKAQYAVAIKKAATDHPIEFTQWVCDLILDTATETNPLKIETPVRKSELEWFEKTKRAYRDIASLIVRKKSFHLDPAAEFISLEDGIVSELDMHWRHMWPPRMLEDMSATGLMRALAWETSEALGVAVNRVAQWMWGGVPPYKKTEGDGAYQLAPHTDETYTYLREMGHHGSGGSMMRIPLWAQHYFIRQADLKVYAWFFSFDHTPDEEEISGRRNGLRKQLNISIPHNATEAAAATEERAWRTNSATWPPHDTKHLTALRLAAVKFWANYDPLDPSTAPTNTTVSHWLQKHHGISATVADVMATILRPDGMKPGPRPSPK